MSKNEYKIEVVEDALPLVASTFTSRDLALVTNLSPSEVSRALLSLDHLVSKEPISRGVTGLRVQYHKRGEQQ